MMDSDKDVRGRINASIRGWRADVVASLSAYNDAAQSLSGRLARLREVLAAQEPATSASDARAAFLRIGNMLDGALSGVAAAQFNIERRIEHADRNFERLMILLSDQQGDRGDGAAAALAELLEDRDAEIARLEAIINRLDADIEKIREDAGASVSDAEARAAQLAQSVHDRDDALRLAEENAAELAGRHAALSKAYGELAVRHTDASETAKLATSRVEQLEGRLAEAHEKEMPADLVALAASLPSLWDAAQQTASARQAELEAQASRLADTLQVQMAKLAEAHHALRNRAAIEAELVALREQAASYDEERSVLDRQLAEKETELETLRGAWDLERQAATSMRDTLQVELENVRLTADTLTVEVDQSREALSASEQSVAALREERDAVILERDGMREAVATAEERMAAAVTGVTRERDDLQSLVEASQQQATRLAEEKRALEESSRIAIEEAQRDRDHAVAEAQRERDAALRGRDEALVTLQQRDESVAALQGELSGMPALMSELEELRGRLDDFNAQSGLMQSIQSERDDLREHNRNLEAVETDLRTQLETALADYEATRREASDLNLLLSERDRNVAALQDLITQRDESLADMQRRMEERQAEVQTQRDQIAVLEARIAEAQREREGIEHDAQSARAELASRESMLQEVSRELEASVARVSRLEQEAKSREDALIAREQEAESASHRAQSAESRSAEIQAELDGVRLELDRARQDAGLTSQKVDHSSARLDIQQREIEMQTERISALESERELLLAQLDETRGHGEGAVGALEHARAELELLRGEIAGNRDTLSQMSAVLNDREAELTGHAAALAEKDERIQNLSVALDNQTSLVAQAEERASAAQFNQDNSLTRISELEAALNDLQITKAALQEESDARSAAKTDELLRVRQELDALQQQYNSLDNTARLDAERAESLARELELHTGSAEEITARASAAEARAAELDQELQSLRAAHADTESRRDWLEQQMQQSAGAEESLRNEAESLRQRLTELEASLQAGTLEREQLLSAAASRDGELSELSASHATALDALASVTSQLEMRNAEAAEWSQRGTALEAELQSLRQQVEGDGIERGQRLAELEEQVASLETLLRQKADECAQLTQDLAEAKQEHHAASPVSEEEGDMRGDRLSALFDAFDPGGTPVEETPVAAMPDPNLARLHDQLAELNAELQRTRSEVEVFRGNLAEREADISERNEAVIMAQQEAANLREELRETIVRLNNVQMEARETVHRLNAEIQARGQAEDTARSARSEAGRMRVSGVGFDTLLDDDDLARQKILIAQAKLGEGKHALGELLVDAGVISAGQLDDVLKEQKRQPGRMLGTLLMDKEIASEDAVAQAIACQTRLPLIRPREQTIEKGATDLLRRDICAWHVIIPLRMDAERLVLAMANPLDESALNKVRDLTRKEVIPVVATPSDILAAIEDSYGAF